MPEQSNDYRVVVFGAGGVGKSSLVLRFVKGTFRESYIPTVEDTYRQVNFTIQSRRATSVVLWCRRVGIVSSRNVVKNVGTVEKLWVSTSILRDGEARHALVVCPLRRHPRIL